MKRFLLTLALLLSVPVIVWTQNGAYTTTPSSFGTPGTVTSIATTSPITGGTITTTGTIACATCTITIASGDIALATAEIASGACTSAQTDTATGTATTDVIIYTPAADPTGIDAYEVSATGSVYIWAYPTSNTANFKVCNNTAGALTPGALTINWKVVR